MRLNDIEQEVLGILKTSAQDGLSGLYRSEIFDASKLAETRNEVSYALNGLLRKGLARKGERAGLKGSLWTFHRSAEEAAPEPASNEVEKTEQKEAVPEKTSSATAKKEPEDVVREADPAASVDPEKEELRQLADELDAVKLRLEAEPQTIARADVKYSALADLADLFDGRLGRLLREVALDIQRVGRL